jgi:hypothetical protein
MPAPVVAVVGLRALQRDLARQADDAGSALGRAIRAAGKAAIEPVAARARAAVPVRSGRLRRSIRTSGTKTGATVRMGRASVRYAGAIEFGGYPPGREYRPAGRYLFPAAAELGPVAAYQYQRVLTQVFASPAIWTNTTNDGGAVHD